MGDPVEGDPNFGFCNANLCTLRTAITVANSTPGKDTIDFSIPRASVQSIRPSEPLPAITDPVVIDGYTQFGAEPNTKAVGNDAQLLIELDGVNAGPAVSGLRIEADDVTVRGFVVQRFGDAGISINGDANRVEGNFIGTDASGQSDRGNGSHGVLLLEAKNSSVGGTTPDARNVISGNAGNGVAVSLAGGIKVEGNLVGTKKDGTSALGNGNDGVDVVNSANSIVGSEAPGAANTIAFNSTVGVEISGSATGNPILRNSVFSNAGQGIDLGDDGRTDNDADDDPGPNNLQNFPVLASAKSGRDRTTIKGNLNSKPEKTFTVQVFSTPPPPTKARPSWARRASPPTPRGTPRSPSAPASGRRGR